MDDPLPSGGFGVLRLEGYVEHLLTHQTLQLRRNPPPVAEDSRSVFFVEILNHDQHFITLLHPVV